MNKDDKQLSIESSMKSLRALDCVSAVSHSLNLSSQQIVENNRKLRALYLNTADRIRAKLKISENFHGQVVETYSMEEACNF